MKYKHKKTGLIAEQGKYGHIYTVEQYSGQLIQVETWLIDNADWEPVEEIRTPVFVSDDNETVYENDEYCAITTDYNIRFCLSSAYNKESYRILKRFKHRAKAEEYVLWNKPCLSLADVFNEKEQPERGAIIYPSDLTELVKQKLNGNL